VCTFQLQESWMFCSYFTWEITTPATRFPHVSQNQSPPGLYHQRCVTVAPGHLQVGWKNLPKDYLQRASAYEFQGKGVVSCQFSETFCQKILNMIRSMLTDSLSLHHHLRWGLGTLVSNGLLNRILKTYPKFNNSPLVVGTRRSGDFSAQQLFRGEKNSKLWKVQSLIFESMGNNLADLPPTFLAKWNQISPRFSLKFQDPVYTSLPKKTGPKIVGGNFPGWWFMAPLSEACTLHWNIQLPEAEVGSTPWMGRPP